MQCGDARIDRGLYQLVERIGVAHVAALWRKYDNAPALW
jgi:hypothetical protein